MPAFCHWQEVFTCTACDCHNTALSISFTSSFASALSNTLSIISSISVLTFNKSKGSPPHKTDRLLKPRNKTKISVLKSYPRFKRHYEVPRPPRRDHHTDIPTSPRPSIRPLQSPTFSTKRIHRVGSTRSATFYFALRSAFEYQGPE